MGKLKELVVSSITCLIINKKRGDEQIVIKLILIGIAVVLGFLFKTEVTDIVTTAMDSFSTKINTLIV